LSTCLTSTLPPQMVHTRSIFDPKLAPNRPPEGPKEASNRPLRPRCPPRAVVDPRGPHRDPPKRAQASRKLAPIWPQVGPKSAGRRFTRRQNCFEVASCAEDDSRIEFRTESGPVLDLPGGRESGSRVGAVQISSISPLSEKDPLRKPKFAPSRAHVGFKLAPRAAREATRRRPGRPRGRQVSMPVPFRAALSSDFEAMIPEIPEASECPYVF